jgi:hypothetical protein
MSVGLWTKVQGFIALYFIKEVIRMANENKEAIEAKIVEPKGHRVKQNPIARLKSAIFVTSKEELKQRIIDEVIIPGIKDVFADILYRGVDIALYDDSRGGRRGRRGRGRGRDKDKPSYSSYYEEKERKTSRTSSSAYYVDDVEFDSKLKADEVWDSMVEDLEAYDVVTVYQYYFYAGEHTEFTDEDWGWDSLEGCTIKRSRGGWCIHMTKPKPLK